MATVSKRIFDTDNALKGSFNGLFGKWQLITYSFFVFGYSIIVGWVNNLHDFTLLEPMNVSCTPNYTQYNNRSVIQRLSGKTNETVPLYNNFSNEYGESVVSEFEVFCDLNIFVKYPRFSHYLGFIIGCFVLGFASDRGGRKMIILACIWTTGIMSLFQLVGHDFISYVFFQFFIGLFIGGVHSSFLPAILEMFPINFRTFYGVFFHLIICLFELLLPWLAKSFKSWKLLQIFVTAPLIITAVLQWFVYESIFWYLAHKEYDKAIKVLTKLAKRNGISFEKKFAQAKEFLHAKHSKATQVDILPLLRLQDLDVLGKKYPQVDMAELQKQKLNSSKLRRFLNSLKGASYRSTNTIYRPFDFIYSPTLFVYVLILCGLWLTNGLTDSMETIKNRTGQFDVYLLSTISDLSCILSSTLAIVLAIFRMGRRWMIFCSYLIIEICLLGSLIANLNHSKETEATLTILYHLCKFSTHFGFIFLMLITAELFPTSLRCTGLGICFIFKMIGSAISSPNLMNYNTTVHRLIFCLLTLFFGSMTLFLPETKTFPLPRSILQIEAMPTTIGKKLRSRKVQLACDKRQLQLAEKSPRYDYKNVTQSLGNNQTTNVAGGDASRHDYNSSALQYNSKSTKDNYANTSNDGEPLIGGNEKRDLQSSSGSNNATAVAGSYDTVTSIHDIEQDDHIYYAERKENTSHQPLLGYERQPKLGKIVEVPSKVVTRNNSYTDLEHGNTKI